MTDLSGKHALVTGGGTGVGAAIALALAGVGANVTITGRRQAPLDEVAGKHANIHPTTGDVTDERSVAQMFDVANKSHGPVDIVIANAPVNAMRVTYVGELGWELHHDLEHQNDDEPRARVEHIHPTEFLQRH